MSTTISIKPLAFLPGDNVRFYAEAAKQWHIEQQLEVINQAITEAQIRTSALAEVITKMVAADEDSSEAERHLMEWMDRLMELRSDYSALSFLHGHPFRSRS